MAHLCGVRPTDNLKLRDFFTLVVSVDQYLKEQKKNG